MLVGGGVKLDPDYWSPVRRLKPLNSIFGLGRPQTQCSDQRSTLNTRSIRDSQTPRLADYEAMRLRIYRQDSGAHSIRESGDFNRGQGLTV